MNLIRVLVVSSVVIFGTPVASASQVLQRVVTQVNVVELAGVPNVIVKVQGGVPSQSCSDQTAYVRPLTNDFGKHLLAMALTALSTEKLVDIIGTNSCGVFSAEIMQEIKVYK